MSTNSQGYITLGQLYDHAELGEAMAAMVPDIIALLAKQADTNKDAANMGFKLRDWLWEWEEK